MKSYSEMKKLKSFNERLEYLMLLDNNALSPRHMSMRFYKSKTWDNTRKAIIFRDLGFDLGCFDIYIDGAVYVHHINPISEHDIIYQTDKLLDPENLVCTSLTTHNIIHYGRPAEEEFIERKPNDHILW